MVSINALRFLLVVVGVGLVSCQFSKDDDDAAFPSFLTALGSKLAAMDNDDDTSDDDLATEPTAPCCFPNVWQGRVVSEFGFAGRKPTLSRAVDQVYIDGSNKRLAGNKLECHYGHPLNYSYIMLVAANKSADFYLFDKTAKKCKYMKLKDIEWKPQCIPANATLRGTRSLGPSPGGLTVQSWTFRVGSRKSALVAGDRPRPRPKVSVASNILVVPGTCVPVVIQENGDIRGGGDQLIEKDEDSSSSDDEDNEKRRTTRRPKPRPRDTAFVGGMYFTDVQTRITDPSVFTPPSYCKKEGDNGLYYDDNDMGDNLDEIIPSVLEGYFFL